MNSNNMGKGIGITSVIRHMFKVNQIYFICLKQDTFIYKYWLTIYLKVLQTYGRPISRLVISGNKK